ncbi:MAG: hypothetical protein KZY74_10855 [Paenibacillaceae bacterium]|nr:hypothetical protein [Paenibacillaceae bacterium]
MFIDEDTLAEMERGHADWLKRLEQSADRLGTILLELPVPQNAQAYASLHGLTRFHNSLLAFRLLVVSGFSDDAAGVLRRMGEAAVMVKFVSTLEEKQILSFMEEAAMVPLVPDEAVSPHTPELRTIAEAADRSKGCDKLKPSGPLAGWHSLLEADEPEDWFPPIGPAPFDAADLLWKGCRLADILLEVVQECGFLGISDMRV